MLFIKSPFARVALAATALLLPPVFGSETPGAPPPPAQREADKPAIRAFDLDTLGELGREIFRHDQLAWHGTDALMESVDRETLMSEGSVGWVVDTGGPRPLLRFLRQRDGVVEASFDIVFEADGTQPRVAVPEDRSLTDEQSRHHRATRAGLDALIAAEVPWCGGNPNFVVLDDPDDSGFLVYILRPKEDMDQIPVGGHYRITVGKDGETVEQIDQLFASCLTVSRSQDLPEGASIAAVSMSHIVSDTPLETHVFLSLQEKLPFAVITPDSRMWRIENGVIAAMNAEGSE